MEFLVKPESKTIGAIKQNCLCDHNTTELGCQSHEFGVDAHRHREVPLFRFGHSLLEFFDTNLNERRIPVPIFKPLKNLQGI